MGCPTPCSVHLANIRGVGFTCREPSPLPSSPSTGAVTWAPNEDQAQNEEARGEEQFSLWEVQPHLCMGLEMPSASCDQVFFQTT